MKKITILLLLSVALTACNLFYPQNQSETVRNAPAAETPETTTTAPAAEVPETTTTAPAAEAPETARNHPAAGASETTTHTPATKGEAKPLYTVSIEAPETVKKNEVFSITATLLNSSGKRTTIMHASQLFIFRIKDSKGMQVNVISMDHVGIMRGLRANETITETYQYKLESTGQYEASAIAQFRVGEGNYELETNKSVFEVVPQ
ncbi:hypothetical protein FE784_31010 [Paenibacillus hemerocallicola]|uniref:Intracellular proteinase inhibitor BsuPI domain-containing protein n=1 Tax=Paenibacillus hemerocallicola TaxID=1172614 RepID=A0A5C4T093_9BACL|nr:hypothetical protein [Paenibacillus hemerocallicola]TNJ62404.1 hypothetical protein FE784_31010 [Paenibacillus hemerocallicola]